MGGKEKEKGLEVNELAEIIENSKEILWWGIEEMRKGKEKKQIRLILLKTISSEDAQRLKELGLEFSNKFRCQTSERLPFKFWFDSAFSPRNELSELDISKLTSFRDKEQGEGRLRLFKTEQKEKLYGLAKFGEKYDGIKQADCEPGFFALIIFLKRESENVE